MMNIRKRIVNGYKTIAVAVSEHVLFYPSPINLNYIWSFGSLVGLFFALQLITGIFLAMHYTAHVDLAFDSVVHIMNDVKNGWLMRYMHANGASIVFILIYCHIAKGLYYRSYLYSRRYLWWSGIVIFILMMATAFIGYVLPWGQMSFWGATVITSLVTAIPFVGENIAYWVWGGFSISNATLVRFFSLHYLLPFLITAIILLHLVLLHKVGSTEPTQSVNPDKIPFHPYYTYKDGFSLAICLLLFIILVFFYPNLLGHSDNFIKANPLVTPAHIVPEWYFTPFYAILRACPNKLGGVISMVAALLILLLLPFYTVTWRSVPSAISPFYKLGFWCFFFVFLTLMFLGGQAAAAPFVMCSKIFTILYFSYFIIILPFVDKIENSLITRTKVKYDLEFEERKALNPEYTQVTFAALLVSGEQTVTDAKEFWTSCIVVGWNHVVEEIWVRFPGCCNWFSRVQTTVKDLISSVETEVKDKTQKVETPDDKKTPKIGTEGGEKIGDVGTEIKDGIEKVITDLNEWAIEYGELLVKLFKIACTFYVVIYAWLFVILKKRGGRP